MIDDLINYGHLPVDDPKFNFFTEKIIPSVVNIWITPKGVNSHSFRCPFEKCAVLVCRSVLLERHLFEEHYDELPKGVFDYLYHHECMACGRSFVSEDHYERHKN